MSYWTDPTIWVPGTQPYESVSAGTRHGMAVGQDGTLWTWGSNSKGQLGTNAALGSSFGPFAQESTRARNWITAYAGRDTSIAAKSDGSVWGWGDNSAGQLGLGNTTSRNTPVKLSFRIR